MNGAGSGVNCFVIRATRISFNALCKLLLPNENILDFTIPINVFETILGDILCHHHIELELGHTETTCDPLS